MLFTDSFVYVHEPKTGGTFVTSVLFRLYEFNWTYLTRIASALRTELVHRHRYGTLIYHNNKHGGCNEIPAAQRHKTVLATVRNPYDLYVSQYEFGWWKRNEWRRYFEAIPGFQQQYPHFPAISFAEYVTLSNLAFCDHRRPAGDDAGIGLLSEKFIKFYCQQPEAVLAALTSTVTPEQVCRAALHDIHFIRTDQLNNGLYQFLLARGYDQTDIRFICGLDKILPGGKGRRRDQSWERYYTPDLKQSVRQKERIIFALFPEFDV